MKEEVKLKSVVETIKKLHKMTVQSKQGKDFSCYLCKSAISQDNVKQMEVNFQIKDGPQPHHAQRLESLRSGLLAEIESMKACDGHREALVIEHIKQRVAELEKI